MAKTPAASARKKTPAKARAGRSCGSRSKTPRSGARSTPKASDAITTSETLLYEDDSHRFFSAVECVPRREKFVKSDPLAPPTFGQSVTDTWCITIGDLACIEAPVGGDVDERDDFPPGPRRVAPFTAGWRPCQILSLFRKRVEVRRKLSTEKHWDWGRLQVEVRWFYRHADLDDRNRRHEKSRGGAFDKEEVFESGHVAVLDASLLLSRLVLRRPYGEVRIDDFLKYPVPSVVYYCHRFYLRKERDVFEAFDGEGMIMRGMECSKFLQNDHGVRKAAYEYLGLSLTETKADAVKAEAVVALPSPLKTIKDKEAVSAYYSSCILDHPWPQLTHGNLMCPPAKRDAFPKWQLCVGDIVAVHCFESAPASGLDVIPGRNEWYPYRVPWSHCQVIAICRTFDKTGDVPGEDSSVPASSLFCEIRWFQRVSEAQAVIDCKKMAADRLENIAKDAKRMSEEIVEGDQVSTIHLLSLLGPVLIDNGPKSPVCRFLPHNRRTISNTVKCNAAGEPIVVNSRTDLRPTFRVRRGIDGSDCFVGKGQRASSPDEVLRLGSLTAMSSPRRSSRRQGRNDGVDNRNLDQLWRQQYIDLGHCRIAKCTRRLIDASDPEVDQLRSMGISFVGSAVSAAASWATAYGRVRVAKERDLVGYLRAANERNLPLNEECTGESAVELAAYHGLNQVLTLLLDEGCPLKKTAHRKSNAVHAAVRNGQLTSLQTILSKRQAEARTVLREESATTELTGHYSSTLRETIDKGDAASAQMLLSAGCASMSDIDAKYLFHDTKGFKRHKQLERLLKMLYPSIPNVMHWRGGLHWSFPTTDRETMNWLWHAIHRPTNPALFPDEVWRRIFSYFGRGWFACRRYESIGRPSAPDVLERNII